MFKKITLQTWLIGSFIFIGLIVLIVALVGWSGNHRLTDRMNQIGKNAFPSVIHLWKINEAMTQIQSSERSLLSPRANIEIRQSELAKIEQAKQKINADMMQYEKIPHNEEEERLYQTFLRDWEDWKATHQEFIALNKKFESFGILRPGQVQFALLKQGRGNSSEIAAANAASAVLDQMNVQTFTKKMPAFYAVKNSLEDVLAYNEGLAATAMQLAEQDVSQTTFWVVLGMIIGPMTAATFGIYFVTRIARPLANQIQHSAIQVTTSSTQIAASGKQLEAMVVEQVASTNEVVATTKEIAVTSEQLVKTMDEVAEMSQATATAVDSSQQDLQRMETTMRQLAEATNTISTKLGVISEKANNINTVVTTITKVADQTNLLSLNAAIEAEKAGEYGFGFAVVAREIRRLADQTAVATLDIEQMVKEMQSAVATGVMEMDKFTKDVDRGVEDIRSISVQITEIIQQVQALTPRFEAVNQGMEAQSQGAGQITEAMLQLSEASSQTAESLREINRAIGQLNEAAHGLRQAISRLKAVH